MTFREVLFSKVDIYQPDTVLKIGYSRYDWFIGKFKDIVQLFSLTNSALKDYFNAGIDADLLWKSSRVWDEGDCMARIAFHLIPFEIDTTMIMFQKDMSYKEVTIQEATESEKASFGFDSNLKSDSFKIGTVQTSLVDNLFKQEIITTGLQIPDIEMKILYVYLHDKKELFKKYLQIEKFDKFIYNDAHLNPELRAFLLFDSFEYVLPLGRLPIDSLKTSIYNGEGTMITYYTTDRNLFLDSLRNSLNVMDKLLVKLEQELSHLIW